SGGAAPHQGNGGRETASTSPGGASSRTGSTGSSGTSASSSSSTGASSSSTGASSSSTRASSARTGASSSASRRAGTASGGTRGIAANHPPGAGFSPKITWWYNWSLQSKGADVGIEFVPMAWGASSVGGPIPAGSKYLLGFNEPNFQSQSNLTPQQA